MTDCSLGARCAGGAKQKPAMTFASPVPATENASQATTYLLSYGTDSSSKPLGQPVERKQDKKKLIIWLPLSLRQKTPAQVGTSSSSKPLCGILNLSAFPAIIEKRRRGACSLHPLRTVVPFWGQTTQIPSVLSPKRDCGTKRLKPLSGHVNL